MFRAEPVTRMSGAAAIDEDIIWRMRRARLAFGIVCFAWLAVTCVNLYDGLVGAAEIDIAVIVVTLLCYVVGVTQPTTYRYVTHLAIFASVAGLVVLSYFHGLSRSNTLWFVAPAPLAAAYLLDYRASLKWAAFCSLLIFGVEVWRRVAPIPPGVAEQGTAVILRIVVLLWLVLGILLAVGRAQSRQVKELLEREQTIRNLADNLQKQGLELAATRDEALLAAKAKSEFLAVMSHEIRTPLNAVIGLADVLANAALEPRERDFARTIRASGNTLLSLFNNCLDFSRIEAKKLTLESAPFDLVACTEEALDMFASAAAEKKIRIECVADPTVPALISADAARVRQVIVNLVSNGVKFTERGSVVVKLSAAPTEVDGQTLLTVSVSDTGIGVAPEEMRKLFQPFRKVDSSTTRRFGGTGLGLAISRCIAELMGGSLSVESEVDRGSVFCFSFVADVVEEAAVPPPSKGSIVAVSSPNQPTHEAVSTRCESASGEVSRKRGLDVLVAEDDVVNQKVLLFLLERLGHRVDLAMNGQQAVEAALRQSYDLVLMDVCMPEMDGLEATRRIRVALPGASGPRIIAVTANVTASDEVACREAGMDDFMGKPVQPKILERMIQKWSQPPSALAPAFREGA
ncbi:MAG: response regulator [Polyangiaceae bacterium]|nr:response regulator [Polyangiaceae bacterium]